VDLPFHNEPAQLRSIFPIDWTIFPGPVCACV